MPSGLSFCLALSLHLMPGEWNNTHPCVRYTNDPFIAGLYFNSERSLSSFVGVEFGLTDRLALEAGLVTGYTGYTVAPFGRLTYELTDGVYNYATLGVYDGQVEGVVVGLELRFN